MGGRLFASHVRAGAAGAAEPSFVTPGHGNRPLPGLRGLVLESGGQRPPGDDDAIDIYILIWRRAFNMQRINCCAYPVRVLS